LHCGREGLRLCRRSAYLSQDFHGLLQLLTDIMLKKHTRISTYCCFSSNATIPRYITSVRPHGVTLVTQCHKITGNCVHLLFHNRSVITYLIVVCLLGIIKFRRKMTVGKRLDRYRRDVRRTIRELDDYLKQFDIPYCRILSR
jgi:hypothetical protein